METRIAQELDLLRTRYPEAEYRPQGFWVRIPKFKLPPGWSRDEIDLVIKFPDGGGFPQNPFYGFYVPSDLRFNGQQPNGNYTNVAPAQPPFEGGPWAIFSGNPDPWTPKPLIEEGSNILSWIHGITERLREGL